MTTSPADPQAHEARRRAARRRVKTVDRIARTIITIGGLGVIGAVLGILVFLTAEVVPLFGAGTVEDVHTIDEPGLGADIASVSVDEHQGLVLVLTPDATVHILHLEDGTPADEPVRLAPDGKTVTALVHSKVDGSIALGFDDGSVQLGEVAFEYEFLADDDVTDELASLEVEDRLPFQGGYVTHASEGSFRWTRAAINMNAPTSASGASVTRLHYAKRGGSEYVAVARDDGSVTFNRVRITRPLGGGTPRVRLSKSDVDFQPPAGETSVPDRIFTTTGGDSIYAVWKSGSVERYGAPEGARAPTTRAERVDLNADGAGISSAAMLLGGATLVLGLDDGRVLAVFTTPDPNADTPDRRRAVIGHRFDAPSDGVSVTSLAMSSRDRSFVSGYSDGSVIVRHMTSSKTVLRPLDRVAGPVDVMAVAPKYDGLLALTRGESFRFWEFERGYPEASFRSLFGKVWYEGESEPRFLYQSSSGEDTAEVKLSLTPLISGTLKATLFAMLFAAPLGILAAIYTSEFLHPSVRSMVKPTVEAMASLPSVVLGFVTALVIAPYAREWLPGILLGFGAVPFAVLLAAHLWQMTSVRRQAWLPSWLHMVFVAIVVGVSLLLSIAAFGSTFEQFMFKPRPADRVFAAWGAASAAAEVAPEERSFDVPESWATWVELVPEGERPEWLGTRVVLNSAEARRLQAEGMYFQQGDVFRPVVSDSDPGVLAVLDAKGLGKADIRYWLDGVIGGPFPGWFLLAAPFGFFLASILKAKFADPLLRNIESLRQGPHVALVELIKLLATVAAGLAIAALAAWGLTLVGMDPRDSIFGTFTQRNTLIVGMVMGFAVIPIIFTIAEDALGSVPTSLRSASLGAGATRWQTAIRVVLPVAASGIFSATMIGLGRAVGETMIVLMATGNTPTMSWNVFEGFRTLAANIAVELPEAPQGETHYRILFLCGLVLFVMTFAINTTAEIVRQRFRKRSAAL